MDVILLSIVCELVFVISLAMYCAILIWILFHFLLVVRLSSLYPRLYNEVFSYVTNYTFY